MSGPSLTRAIYRVAFWAHHGPIYLTAPMRLVDAIAIRDGAQAGRFGKPPRMVRVYRTPGPLSP